MEIPLSPFPSDSEFGKVVPASNSYQLELAPWPSEYGRNVEGGNSDAIIKQSLPTLPSDQHIVRIDGSVVYENKDGKEFGIAVTNDQKIIKYAVPAGRALIVPAGVAHSLPFLKEGQGNFEVTSRKTNGVFTVTPGSTFIVPVAPKQQRKLDKTFSDLHLKVQETDDDLDIVIKNSISEGRFLTPNGSKKKLVTVADWPLLSNHAFSSSVDALEQEFTMQWIDEGDRKEVLFKGLSGTLSGGEGRPGVVYDNEQKTISVNLLLSRPDGSFFIATDDILLMIIAEKDQHTGEPKKDTLRAVNFKNGVKLPSGWWHSVPFPHPDTELIHLYEKVASSNANIVINVKEETGTPITVAL